MQCINAHLQETLGHNKKASHILKCSRRFPILPDREHYLRTLTGFRPDLVLLDIAIKGDKDGIDIATIINDKYKVPFIYITSFADKETLDRAKATLPSGNIVKPFKDRDIISAIEMAVYRHASLNNLQFPSFKDLSAHYLLTPGEYQVLQCVWEGNTNLQVTEKLNVSINTIKTHLKNIFSKMSVGSRSAAIAAVRNSMLGHTEG